MTKIIEMNIPQKYFVKDRNNRLEARLAKFELNKGDIIRFFEVDENKTRTGKSFDRKVNDFHKIHKALKYWSKKDMLQYGIYVLDLGSA